MLKKGKPSNELKSYRLVALTPHVSKRLINRRLMWYLERNDGLCPEQAGYRTARTATEQVVRIVQLARDALHDRKHVMLICVDQSAAFDRARQTRLHREMCKKNVPPRFILWTQAFLSERKACVRVNGERSADVVMEEGFPQATVHGGTYWNLYCDTLPATLRRNLTDDQCEVSAYADDCGILLMEPTQAKLRAAAQGVMDRLAVWEEEHDAVVSMKEGSTEYLILHGPKGVAPTCDPKVKFNCQPLRRAKDGVIKFLGVYVDGAMNFAVHAQHVRDKLDKKLKVLKCFTSHA